jgi:Fic family protein
MKIPLTPPVLADLLQKSSANSQRLLEIIQSKIGPTPKGEYLHWDKLRHLQPPEGFSLEEWWLAAKWARTSLYRALPFADKYGRTFQYAMPDLVLKFLHQVDRETSAQIQASEQITNPQTRDSYLVSSLIEEAITSSQLEGASTTRKVAKEMLREGRKPRTRSEQMIFNNYRAMQFIRGIANEEMTPAIVFELHRILVEQTLDDATAAGRLRREEEDIHVVDTRDSEVLHTPPDAAELKSRLVKLCRFANDRDSEPFMHPTIRAIILHFMLAYDHPFTDGNGRTARALFYWSMLNQGYWLTEYISISRILKSAPSEYARAYLYTETDDRDVTYFIVHQLNVMLRALKDLQKYLGRKVGEVQEVEDIIRKSRTLQDKLNHRQVAVLGHGLRHPNIMYRIEGHRQSHNVTYDTARTDLLELADLGLFDKTRSGKAFVFVAPANLAERLKRLDKDHATRK